jgi:choline kinase
VDALRVNTRWAQTNMVRSLQVAGEWLAEAPTLVVYGDGAYGSAAVAQALAASAHDLVVPIDLQWQALWSRRFTRPLDDAETLSFEGDRLTGIGQRPTSIGQVQAQFMGLLRMTPAGWRRVGAWLDQRERTRGAEAVDRLDTTSMLSGLIAGGEPVYCTSVDGGWVEIDSVTDCAVAEAGLSDPKFCHDFRT